MKKEKRKISLATYIITLLIMLVIIIALICVIIGERNENVVTSGEASNTENQNTTVVEEEPKLIANTNYVEIVIEDAKSIEGLGLAYTKSVKIDDEKIIERLENIVNNGTEFTVESTEGPDIPPVVTFYLENGEEYEVAANDKDGDNEISISKYNEDSDEFEWKRTYKIDTALGEYITELYNQYKDTNTIDDSREGLQKILEEYIGTDVIEDGESYTINEMNQIGRRTYEATYDYSNAEGETTQGTLTVTFEKDADGEYFVEDCEFND